VTRPEIIRELTHRGLTIAHARELVVGTAAEPRVHLPAATSYDRRQLRELGFFVNAETGALIPRPK